MRVSVRSPHEIQGISSGCPENLRLFQKFSGKGVVLFSVKVMDVTGGDKGFWLIAAYQFAEFIKGHIRVSVRAWAANRGGSASRFLRYNPDKRIFPAPHKAKRTIFRSVWRKHRCCNEWSGRRRFQDRKKDG